MADSSFWRDLAEKFLALQGTHGVLHADRDYKIGSGEPAIWTVKGAGSPTARTQFETLAKRGASALPYAGSSDLFFVWLEALMRNSTNFTSDDGDSFEPNDDGSRLYHLRGTISRVCETSANYCSVLEGQALEAEFREKRQKAPPANDPKASEIAPRTAGSLDPEPVRETEDSRPATEAAAEIAGDPAAPATLIPDSVAEEGLTPRTTVTSRGKRGPQRDFKTAMKVDEVAIRLAPDGDWRGHLDAVCESLDEAEVRRPKPWKAKGHRTWFDCMIAERPLVIKAIEHHLELAREHKKTFS